MYVFEGKNNMASVVYDDNTLAEEEKISGIYATELPIKQNIEGKTAILKADKKTNYIWWEYQNLSEETIETKILSKAKFLKRLTFDEKVKISNYEKYITGEDYEIKVDAMKALWNEFNTFVEVDLSDAEWCAEFSQIIVWTGLITAERIAEIIGA